MVPGTEMKISHHIFESYLILFVADPELGSFQPESESGIFSTLDPRWKNSEPGSGINIPDPDSRTCTLFVYQRAG
jgi:hypothetical protein